jgi:ribosomal protein S18 acetylase RimI-like enzyme
MQLEKSPKPLILSGEASKNFILPKAPVFSDTFIVCDSRPDIETTFLPITKPLELGSKLRSDSMPSITATLHTEWLTDLHFPGILQIERDIFDRHLSIDDLSKIWKSKGTRGFVHQANGDVRGYITLSALETCAVISNLGVARAFQRQGIGSALMHRIFSVCTPENHCHQIFAMVHESNLTGQLFLRALGFHAAAFWRTPTKRSPGGTIIFRIATDSPALRQHLESSPSHSK